MFGLFKRRPKPKTPDSPPVQAEAIHSDFTEQIQLNRLLLSAAASGNAKRVDEYLRLGADPAWRNTESTFTFDPFRDHAALPLAAESGNAEVVRILLSYRSDPNLKAKGGRTALICAAMAGHDEVVRLLVRSKADPKIEDDEGNTALLYALRKGNASLAALLGRSGPPMRALQWAIESGDLDCVQLAVKLGPPINEPGEDGLLALERIRDLYGSGKLTKAQAASLASFLVMSGGDMTKVGPQGATS